MAFLSHRSTDHEFAEWLLKKLERYPIGKKIRQKYGIRRKHVKPICIDRYEFASKDLQQEMTSKLDASEKMILVCSKASAGVYNPAFDWEADPSLIEGWTPEDWMANAELTGFVGFEIAYMISQGRADDILAVIVDGDPVAGDCFHPLVRDWMKKQDIYYDFRAGAKTDRHTFLKLVSAVLGIQNFSEIFDHDAKCKRLIGAGIVALSAAAVAAGVWTWGYFLPHEKHYADYVLVNGIPQGIEELSGDEYRVASDHYVITTTQASHRIVLEHVNSALTPVEEAVSARIDTPMVAVYQCRSNWNPDTVEFRDRNGTVQITYAYATDLGYVTFQKNEYTSAQVYPTTETDERRRRAAYRQEGHAPGYDREDRCPAGRKRDSAGRKPPCPDPSICPRMRGGAAARHRFGRGDGADGSRCARDRAGEPAHRCCRTWGERGARRLP